MRGDSMGTVLFYSKTMREEVAREMENGSRRADVGCTMGQCRMEDKRQQWCWCHLGRDGWVWSCAESSSRGIFRKPPLATRTCGSGAAWAPPKSTWWGRGPSGNCGQPSLPAPLPLSLQRCPGFSGTGPWPSACRGGWCPELRPAPAPFTPMGCLALSSGAPLDVEPLARVFMCQLTAVHESCCP